jgi:hypothetical protein
MPPARPELYIANQSFSTMLDGEPIGVAKGDPVMPGHKIKGRMNFFDVAEQKGLRQVRSGARPPRRGEA